MTSSFAFGTVGAGSLAVPAVTSGGIAPPPPPAPPGGGSNTEGAGPTFDPPALHAESPKGDRAPRTSAANPALDNSFALMPSAPVWTVGQTPLASTCSSAELA